MNRKNSRRSFIKNASLGAIASLTIPKIVSAAFEHENVKKIKLEKDNVILFQGDSITDWGRNRKSRLPNTSNSLGPGFVLLTAGQLLLNFPDKNLLVYNKGLMGDKVYQLDRRWEADCLQYKPDVLSILVGVNDFWHTLTAGYSGTITTYINDYRKLLHRTKVELPNIQFVICEPFAIKGLKLDDDRWHPTFDLFRKAARDIAHEFNASFVPFQSVFDKATKTAPGSYWSIDGVHPTLAGEALMARALMEVVG